jgi:hypothetical protein
LIAALISTCLLISTDAVTKAYVCNAEFCDAILGPDVDYYPDIHSAFVGTLQNSSNTSPFQFYVVTGAYPDLVALPDQSVAIEIYGYLNQDQSVEHPMLGGFFGGGEAVRASLLLDHIVIAPFENDLTFPCLSIHTLHAYNITLEHSLLHCPTMIKTAAASQIVFNFTNATSSVEVVMAQDSFLGVFEGDFVQFTASVGVNSTAHLWSNWVRRDGELSIDNSKLWASENGFLQGFHVIARDSKVHLWENWFMAFDEPVRFNQSLLANLILEIRCSVLFNVSANVFYNGTFQISDTSEEHGCPLHLEPGTLLRRNNFRKPDLKFRVYDLLKEPAEPGVTITKGLHNALSRTHETLGYIIDATENFWGDPLGPFLCCNLNGYGAYTSLYINTSVWCRDALCSELSTIVFPPECIRDGCQQSLTKGQEITFILTAALAMVVLLSSTAFNVYHNIRHFNVRSFQEYSRGHLLPKAHIQWRVGMFASTFGSILAVVNILVPIMSTQQTKAHAHQHIIPFRAYAILWMYVAMAVMQILLNSAGLIASVFHLKWFAHLIRPVFFWNILNVIATTVVTLDWIPSGGFVDLLAHFFVTETSKLTNLLYVSTILICLISITAFIPIRLMNELIHHYENAKISAALEIALLKELMRSQDVEAKALQLRTVTIAAFVIGIIPTIATAYDLKIDTYFRMRLIMSVVQHALGMLALVATFAVTFHYNQHLLLTIISVVLGLVSVGCAQDIIFWAYYLSVAVNSVYSVSYVIFQIAASAVWLILLCAEHILIYALDHAIVDELPARAVDNLNMHIDAHMENGGDRERIPLILTQSDTESSLSSDIRSEARSTDERWPSYNTTEF